MNTAIYFMSCYVAFKCINWMLNLLTPIFPRDPQAPRWFCARKALPSFCIYNKTARRMKCDYGQNKTVILEQFYFYEWWLQRFSVFFFQNTTKNWENFFMLIHVCISRNRLRHVSTTHVYEAISVVLKLWV